MEDCFQCEVYRNIPQEKLNFSQILKYWWDLNSVKWRWENTYSTDKNCMSKGAETEKPNISSGNTE